MTPFKAILPYQLFYLNTKYGRVSFIKLGIKAKVLSSNHYLFDNGSLKKFNNNTMFEV